MLVSRGKIDVIILCNTYIVVRYSLFNFFPFRINYYHQKIIDWSYFGFWGSKENLFLILHFQPILCSLLIMVIIITNLDIKEKFCINGFLMEFSFPNTQRWFHVSKGILFIIIIYINNNKRFSSIYNQRIPTTHSNHL